MRVRIAPDTDTVGCRFVILICLLALAIAAGSDVAPAAASTTVSGRRAGVVGESGVPGLPPAGKVLLGVGGWIYPEDFNRITGHKHNLRQVFLGWSQGESAYQTWFGESEAGGYRLMFHLSTETASGGEAITPRAIARGRGDAYLLRLSAAINESGQVVYVRPMAEMNGHWNPYCAFNQTGSRRNAAHSTKAFRNAFRRIALIVRGGDIATIDRRLRALGLPPVVTDESTIPRSGRVAVVWNPQGEGSPNVPGNQPMDYFPGDAYADWVANDLYSISGHPHWKAQEYMYTHFRRKPFMMAEWAPWGTDDPTFIRAMFDWVRAHPRTRALVYYNGTSGDTFRLRSKPRSLRAYRRLAGDRRFRCANCGP